MYGCDAGLMGLFIYMYIVVVMLQTLVDHLHNTY